MYTVHVRDRGRDLAYHPVESLDEAREIARVYELLGYRADRVIIEFPEQQAAAA
ncbi:MAG: hypothetical protein ACR2GA_00090 [Chloroflexota bacterium]